MDPRALLHFFPEIGIPCRQARLLRFRSPLTPGGHPTQVQLKVLCSLFLKRSIYDRVGTSSGTRCFAVCSDDVWKVPPHSAIRFLISIRQGKKGLELCATHDNFSVLYTQSEPRTKALLTVPGSVLRYFEGKSSDKVELEPGSAEKEGRAGPNKAPPRKSNSRPSIRTRFDHCRPCRKSSAPWLVISRLRSTKSA